MPMKYVKPQRTLVLYMVRTHLYTNTMVTLRSSATGEACTVLQT